MQSLLVRSISETEPNYISEGTYSSAFCLVLCLRFLSISEDELSRRRFVRRTNKSGNFVVAVVVVVVVVVVGSSEGAKDAEIVFSVATSLVTPSVDDTVTDDGVVVVEIGLESGGLVLTGVWRGLVGFDRGELHFLRSGVHALDRGFLISLLICLRH